VINVWGAQIVLGTAEDNYVGTSNATATGATLAANGMNQSYSYDSFGNMVSAGNYNFVQPYTSANQLSGWRYDDAGDLVSDGLGNNYAYDALGQITSDGETSYVYDAISQRVAKIGAVDTDTVYFGGRPLARAASGAWTDLIYGPNGLVAEVPGTQAGLPTYRMVDHLGSSVGLLASNGAVISTQDIAPFGQIFAGGTGDIYQFTGKERDAESGNDYFGARYYGSSMGRFLSPDYSGNGDTDPEPVPWADFENPQTLNLYRRVAQI
jgi:RHS repeat-associated protein